MTTLATRCAARAAPSAAHSQRAAHTRVRTERCAENELSCLEAIHLFVEILDTYFSHVCELDLVWHFHKARRTRDADILRRVADLRPAC